MATFSRGLIQGLINPSYSQNLRDVGMLAGSAPGRRRQKERQANRLERAMEITGRGVASAQLGDTTALSSQMSQLRELIKDPNMPLEEKRMYIQELRTLQNMMPGAQKLQTSNSATALMRIDNELEDEVALRKKINDGYAERGMAPITDAAFKAMTDSLKTQQKRLLEDPDISSQYNQLSIERDTQELQMKRIKSEEWLQSNRSKLSRAVESGKQENVDAVLDSVPTEYREQAKDFVSSEMAFQRETQEFSDNSILRSQEPKNADFSKAIARLPEGLQDEQIKALNEQYVAYIKKHWNADKSEWLGGVGAKKRASEMEQELIRMIRGRSDAATNLAWQRAEDKKLEDEEQILNAERLIRLYQPTKSQIEFEAERIAGEKELLRPGEDLNDLSGEERTALLNEAESYLIQKNTREQAGLIRDIDVSRTPEGVMRPVTQEQAVLVSRFTEEEQKEILEEYARSDGMDSIDEIIEDLQEFGDIGKPSPEKTPDDKPAFSRRGGANEVFRFTLPEKTANLLRGFGVGVSDSDED